MTVLMGPVLGFREGTTDRWRVSVLYVVSRNSPSRKLRVDDGTSWDVDSPKILMAFDDKEVIRFDLELGRAAADKPARYFLYGDAGKTHEFVVPGRDHKVQMAYGSCNGFSDEKAAKKIGDKNERWKHLAKTHKEKRYHLLLLGGDQIYSDAMWVKIRSLQAWLTLPAGDGMGERYNPQAAMPAEMRGEIEKFYFDTYLERWSQPEPAAVFASIPSLMMWDDHDIFDGWGSYPEMQQNCPVYQEIYKIAHRHFAVFQQRIGPGEQPVGAIPNQGFFNAYHQIDGLGIVMLDMRSERTGNRVISLPTWSAIYARLDQIGPGSLKHLFVMSSIPLVHPDFSTAEACFGYLPGQWELEDDLRDHWHSHPHKTERVRLIHRLLQLAVDKRVRITVLSGDVHVGAVGLIEADRSDLANGNATVINQLTSSAIVHPAPTQLMAFALDAMSRSPEEVERGITTSMATFPGTRQRFLLARNWLGLEPDATDRVWANWYVEKMEAPFTKVIHPAA